MGDFRIRGIPEALLLRLKHLAIDRQVPMNTLILEIIADYLKTAKKDR